MGPTPLRTGICLVAAVFFLSTQTSCSSSTSPLTPTTLETRTISNGTQAVYSVSGVIVTAAADSFDPGDALSLGVVLNPADFPQSAGLPAIHERVASVVLSDATGSGTTIQSPLTVRIPLLRNDEVNGNSTLRLLRFDPDAGRWVNTGRNAATSDDANAATFTMTEPGTYGVFRQVPLKLSITPSRTTGKAPFSVALKAEVKGGTPPYTIIWWYGDDSDPDIGMTVSHIYENPSTYYVSAEVTDGEGRSATAFVNLRTF